MTAIVRIKVSGYDIEQEVKDAWSLDTWGRVCRILDKNPETQTRDQWLSADKIIVDDEELEFLVSLGFDCTVRSWKSVMQQSGWPQPKTPMSTEVLTVSVAQNFLLEVSDVMNCDNCCTDELRSYLKEGWRIIAICPQPGNRRPDYILGRKE
jgi:hypothetical protein